MKKSERNVIAVCAVLLMLLGLAFSVYLITRSVESGAVRRAEKSLASDATAHASVLTTALRGQTEALGLVAAQLGRGEMDKATITKTLAQALPDCTCESLIYISQSKTALARTGSGAGLPGSTAIAAAMSGQAAVQRGQATTADDDSVYILVPCVRAGFVTGVVVGAYREENMRALLDAGGDDDAFSLVLDSGGNIIIKSRERTELSNYSNFLNYLAKAVFAKGYARNSILDDLSRGRGGAMRYTRGSDSFMAAYVPVRDERVSGLDWFVLDIMDSSATAEEIDSGKIESVAAVAVFASFSLMAMAAFLVYERMTARRLIEDTKLVRMREERYRLVVAESGREVFQYDIATSAAHRDNILYDYFGDVKDIADWKAFFENSGAADEEGIVLMREMFSRIDSGESPVTFDISLIHPSGERDWNRFHANTVFSDDKRPVTSVISYFNCTYIHESEAAYHRWLDEAKRLDEEFEARFNWNITQDAAEDIYCDRHESLACVGAGLEKWAADYAAAHVFKDDRDAYRGLLKIDRLLGVLQQGTDCESLEYRETLNGQTRWLRLLLRLTKHPQSGEVKARLLYKDIDEIKRKELEIIAKSELDSLTGALNREALAKKVDTLIAENASSTHAVMMLDVDGFKAVNDALGHDEGDEALKAIVAAIKGCLRPDDIVGRIGGDEIMVVLKDIPYDAVIRKKARQLCQALSMRVKGKVDISVSIGIALYPRDANGFEELYKRADIAMYKAKQNGKNGYFFFNQITLQSSGRLNDKLCGISEETGSADGQCVIYLGDSEETARAVTGAFGCAARAYATGDMRAALADMRRQTSGQVAAIIDFGPIEQTLQALTACRADVHTARVVLIAAVDASNVFDIDGVMTAGASDYIVRPFSGGDAARRVNACIIREKRDASFYGAMYGRDGRADESLDVIMKTTGSVLAVYDARTGLFIYNPSIEKMLSGTYDARSLWRIFLSDMVARSADVKRMQAMVSRLASSPGDTGDEMNVTLKTASGERHAFRLRAEKSGEERGAITLVFTDINDSVVKLDRLVFKAERDSLTGLYNADTFFEKAAEMTVKRGGAEYTVWSIDIDDFNVLNERFGRSEGNKALCAVSEKLSRAAHTGGGIVGRVALDNFAVLCPSSSDAAFENAIGDCRGDGAAPSVHAGRYRAGEETADIYEAYDRATAAKNSIKNSDIRIADYAVK